MAIFQPSEKTIGQLFSANTVYVIPTYQRPYAWEEKHLIDLWSDILDTLDQAKRLRQSFPGYFIGALYTRDLDNSTDLDEDLRRRLIGSENVSNIGWGDHGGQSINFVEVLDGQQRLITLFLLRQRLGLLGVTIQLKNGDFIPSVLSAIQDRQFFFDLVYNNNQLAITYSQRKLKNIKNFWTRVSSRLPGNTPIIEVNYTIDNLFRVTDHHLLIPQFAIQIFRGKTIEGKSLLI
jgi:Protein of unknown function DUF262